MNFKMAPRWAAANKVRDAIHALIDSTEGRNVIHTDMYDAVKHFNIESSLGYSPKQCETASYAV